MPTITATPNDVGSWHHTVNLSPGRARVASHVDTDVHPSNRRDTPPTHVIIVEFSPELTDDTGRRVERDAGPGEIQARNGREVVPDPVTVNGKPYGGMIWIERGWHPVTHRHIEPGAVGWHSGADMWRVTRTSLKRLDDGEVTAAAHDRLIEAAVQIAAHVGTAEQLYADRLKAAAYQVEKASKALTAAQQAYDSAVEHMTDVKMETL